MSLLVLGRISACIHIWCFLRLHLVCECAELVTMPPLLSSPSRASCFDGPVIAFGFLRHTCEVHVQMRVVCIRQYSSKYFTVTLTTPPSHKIISPFTIFGDNCWQLFHNIKPYSLHRVTGRGHIDINRISGYIPGKIVFFLMQVRSG